MELSKNYNPSETEVKWNRHWSDKKYFHSQPDSRPSFTVVIPPPNVTGVLHMGHTLNETVQDILVRRARMTGFNACWVPGSDHASIATEAKVVQMLHERGIDKKTLSRPEFLKYAFEWKEKYGGIIYSQIAKLGCSVDWDRVSFTMDDHYYKAVIKVFVNLYKKGWIYRGARMINWDPIAQTALSDEEVEYKDGQGKLYYVKYKVANGIISPKGEDFITIATQRPETIMGDAAICINPNDERYHWLKGQKVIVPMINREIPIIEDDYVDIEFGTGCLKVTPAHDINDYNLGLKHNLPVIDILNQDGTLSEAAQIFVGVERFEARKKVVALLEKEGLLIKEEVYTTRLGYSQRTNCVVEPRISTQWFVKMKELAEPALHAVVDGNIKIHPGDKFLATYKYWLENVKDWCISRQLWWGQQIPAYYDEDGNLFVAETKDEAQQLAGDKSLTQDEDVLDTWFSSWLWPTEVFKGITEPGNEEIKYYYPTSVLVTGQDIIFFWVARMVMAGLEFEHEIPFKDVYFTGMVRDKQGRKMSKSLGNSPDLLGLIDKYGADAVRFGTMISAPAGNDLLFDEAALEQGRNFNNKMWNALKLIQMWQAKSEDIAPDNAQQFALDWMENRLMQAQKEVEKLHKEFKLSEGLKVIYSLIWDDFCSWYLEWIKPGFESPISATVLDKTIRFYEDLLQLLHPYLPFITEEIYHLLKEQTEDLCIKQFGEIKEINSSILESGELLKKVISAIRDARNKNQIKPKDLIKLHIESENKSNYQTIENILSKQVNTESIDYNPCTNTNTIVVAIEKDKFFIESNKEIDTEALKNSLLADLEHQEKFLVSVQKKLSNERFVQNAKPEVVALEQKKQSDAEARIITIKESLAQL
ncbi:valine--tRNA ligase [Rhizosphaericola mali]|uniref:Valine--tRNA ligase n=1 Tax=Rhizosphaericola mali TaxID=2545455 RepID=A0A5P2FY57_9BACT|nr:valine--tRNA ligase [Rhizosphaericola mali]QES88474.1 valine--tRNA ligase [Rhizosphaericola mali]